mmetsp:Transcript_29225/g.76550  ORF Transcript_29225/g.76550 Transcript_29225/m.76550 type:complete len:253 (-) Transcript_29225:213-971(-)
MRCGILCQVPWGRRLAPVRSAWVRPSIVCAHRSVRSKLTVAKGSELRARRSCKLLGSGLGGLAKGLVRLPMGLLALFGAVGHPLAPGTSHGAIDHPHARRAHVPIAIRVVAAPGGSTAAGLCRLVVGEEQGLPDGFVVRRGPPTVDRGQDALHIAHNRRPAVQLLLLGVHPCFARASLGIRHVLLDGTKGVRRELRRREHPVRHHRMPERHVEGILLRSGHFEHPGRSVIRLIQLAVAVPDWCPKVGVQRHK